MRHFPPVLLAAGCVTWDPWVLVGGGHEIGPPSFPCRESMTDGRLQDNNNSSVPSLGSPKLQLM